MPAADRADGFRAGAALAKQQGVPLLVYVHGSDWNLLGRRLLDEVWDDPGTDRLLREFDVVLVDIDVLQSASEDDREKFNQLHDGWKKQGLI